MCSELSCTKYRGRKLFIPAEYSTIVVRVGYENSKFILPCADSFVRSCSESAAIMFLLLLFTIGVASLAVPHIHEIHEKREVLNPRWVKKERIHHRSTLPMRIGLTQNLENAESYLMDVSDPDSPNFAKYWSPEQVIDTFKPTDETIKAVHHWLTTSGIAASRIVHSDNKGWFAFDATGEEAESLLQTEFYEHHDTVTGGKMQACEAYHLPTKIRKYIDYVTPGIKLMAPVENVHQIGKRHVIQSRGSEKRDLLHDLQKAPLYYQRPANAPESAGNLSSCDESITPACIAALYKIPPTNHSDKPVAGNSMGIFESEAEYYAQEDLNLFFKNFTQYIPQGTHPKLAAIDGGLGPTKNISNAGGEADLDILLAYPIIYPQTITLYDVDDPLYQLNPNITYTFGFNV